MAEKPTPVYSGRFHHFLDEIRTGLDFGERPTQVDVATSPEDRDLVAILIKANQDLWDKLLDNDFCKTMKTASNYDDDVLRGFEWYMKQDYFYIANLIKLEADRIPKVKTAGNFATAMRRIPNAANSTGDFFTMLTTAHPVGLGIYSTDVLDNTVSDTMENYIDLIDSTAAAECFVLAKVATIAGLQSICILAVELYKYSVYHDTPWYIFWATVNAQLQRDCLEQQKAFIDSYHAWKDKIDDISDIFEKACQAELDLWNEASKK